MLGCCRVVVAQLSECRQLRLEALGLIPSGYPCIFPSVVSILIFHQLLTTSSVVVNQYSCRDVDLHMYDDILAARFIGIALTILEF